MERGSINVDYLTKNGNLLTIAFHSKEKKDALSVWV